MARKPIEKGLTVAENCLKWGTGGLDIDSCRVETNEIKENTSQRKTKSTFQTSKLGFPRFNGNGTNNSKGRFPANVIHDGSECVINQFPNSKHIERRDAITNTGKNRAFTTHKEGSLTPCYKDQGSAARFFYCAKASQSERNAGFNSADRKPMLPRKNIHPTVKPLNLMKYLIF